MIGCDKGQDWQQLALVVCQRTKSAPVELNRGQSMPIGVARERNTPPSPIVAMPGRRGVKSARCCSSLPVLVRAEPSCQATYGPVKTDEGTIGSEWLEFCRCHHLPCRLALAFWRRASHEICLCKQSAYRSVIRGQSTPKGVLRETMLACLLHISTQRLEKR